MTNQAVGSTGSRFVVTEEIWQIYVLRLRFYALCIIWELLFTPGFIQIFPGYGRQVLFFLGEMVFCLS